MDKGSKETTKKEIPDKSSDSTTNSSDHNYSTKNETKSSSVSSSSSSSNNKDDEHVVSQGRAKKRLKGSNDKNENVSSSSSSKCGSASDQVSTSAKKSSVNLQRSHQNKKEAHSSSTNSINQISSTNNKESSSSSSDKMDADQSINNIGNDCASSTSDGQINNESIKKSNLSSTSSSLHQSNPSKEANKDNSSSSLEHLPRVPPLRIVINNSNSSKKDNNEKVSSSSSTNVPLNNNNNSSQIHTTSSNSDRLFSIDTNNTMNLSISVTSSSTLTNTSNTMATSSNLISTNSLDELDGDDASSSTRDLCNLTGITGRVTRSSQRAAAQQITGDDQSISETDGNKDMRKRKNRFKVNQSIKHEDDDNDSTSSSNSSVNNKELNQLINNQLQCLEKKQFQMPSYNCYHLYLNIRRQVDERRTQQIHLVHPKMPENFNQFLFNTGSYLLDTDGNKFASNNTNQAQQSINNSNILSLRNDNLEIPSRLIGTIMYSLFVEQDSERRRLSLQHRIERDKLRLSAEQEILRVYSRAELAMTNLNLPLLSACTVLKDEEIYNSIDEENSLDNNELFADEMNMFSNLDIEPDTPVKSRNMSISAADKSRSDNKLLNAWLQDVNDKWMKIKEDILLRQRREAESLQAVQRLNWAWRGKDLGFEEFEDSFVPIVRVTDFHLFPISHTIESNHFANVCV